MATTANQYRKRRKPGAFQSVNEAFNRRVMVWQCKSCGLWFYKKSKICTVCGGDSFYYFASKAEAKRFAELELAQKLGQITDLKAQTNYPLYVGDQLITTYRADFVYTENGQEIVEDVKGRGDEAQTQLFGIKRKLLKALYGIDIKITKRA